MLIVGGLLMGDFEGCIQLEIVTSTYVYKLHVLAIESSYLNASFKN